MEKRRFCRICDSKLKVVYATKPARKLKQNGMRGQAPKRSWVCKKHGRIARPIVREV